jgi:hypothetical protein
MTDTSPQPSTVLTGGTTDTAIDAVIPPGAESFEQGTETGDPNFALAKLASFLEDFFPEEVRRTNVQVPDSPVDVAIRLLQGLSASAPLSALPRCSEDYCNQPQGHSSEHGWVHNG